MFRCFDHAVQCPQNNAKSISRTVHTLVMRTVYGETGPINSGNPGIRLCFAEMHMIHTK